MIYQFYHIKLNNGMYIKTKAQNITISTFKTNLKLK